MPEYIDRADVMKKAVSAGLCDNAGNMYGAGEVVLVDDILAIPASEVAPVRYGYWKGSYCSVCGKTNKELTFYCPHCGAKMDSIK